MFAAHVRGFCAGFSLLEDADDLLFGKARFLHGETPGEPFGSRILYL